MTLKKTGMVVFQINTVINKGSVGRIVQGIGDLLISSGNESYIAYARYGGSSQSHLIKIGNYINVLSHVFCTRLTDKHGLFSTMATKKLIRQIEAIHPDIIHIHNLHGYYINYKLLFKYFSDSDIPIVWTLHDCWLFTGHCTYFDYCNCEKWKECCSKCPQINTYPSAYLDNSKYNFLKKKSAFTSINKMFFVPVSDWMNNLLKLSFLKNYPSLVIRNGINLENFNSDKAVQLDYLRDKTVILGIANVWEKRKGFYDFIKLANFLSDDYVIILIGLNKAQMKKCPPNIIGISHTKDVTELASYYTRANVFLNLTYEDNYPTTNLEAIACGTPVITYNTGGSPESVLPYNGYVVDKGDINAVLNCVSEVKNVSIPDRSTLKDFAKKHFDQNRCFQEYLKIYESLID